MGMENELIIGTKNLVSLIPDGTMGELLRPLSSEILLFDTYVAGTSHVKDRSAFEGIRAGDKLILRREPENRFDENAILVLDATERKLGYLPEKDNTVFARLLDAGKYLYAKIDHVEENEYYLQIRIGIYLVDF